MGRNAAFSLGALIHTNPSPDVGEFSRAALRPLKTSEIP
jgi:hypothetical protein